MIRRATISAGSCLTELPLYAFASGERSARAAGSAVVAVTMKTGTASACGNDDSIAQQLSAFANVTRAATAARAGIV
jgi:hypothetical protein